VHDVRLELTQQEAADVAKGVLLPHKVSKSKFLTIGLELEEQQLVLLRSFSIMFLLNLILV